MITTCKKCGSKNLYLEPRIKGQDVLAAAMVALKCKDCGTWLKWCPKDERKFYFNKPIVDKWQKLKDWLEEEQKTFRKISKSLAKADYKLHANYIENILLKIQELEKEDE